MKYNTRVYDYPEGIQTTIYNKQFSTGEDLKKMNENFNKKYKNENRTAEQERHSMAQSLNKTKNNIYHIARSNVWDWFITLTIDPKKLDSTEYTVIVKKLTAYLNNLRKRKAPGMKYLIVPELHKDGQKYHFHGLLADTGKIEFIESGHQTADGEMIYNLESWKYGFSTATKVIDSRRVSGYVTKYITKETINFLPEKKRYYVSRNVDRAEALFGNFHPDDFIRKYNDRIIHLKGTVIPQAEMSVKYIELEK